MSNKSLKKVEYITYNQKDEEAKEEKISIELFNSMKEKIL